MELLRMRVAGIGKASNRLRPSPTNGVPQTLGARSADGHGHETTTVATLAGKPPTGTRLY